MGKKIEQIWIGKTSTCLRVTKLATKIWTQFADHHPGLRPLEAPCLEAIQKTAFDHTSIQAKIFLHYGRQSQKGHYPKLAPN